MYGWLQLPSSWQSKLASYSNRQHGGSLTGVAIMGALSALIVGPCVAPPLAAVLVNPCAPVPAGKTALVFRSLGAPSIEEGCPRLTSGPAIGSRSELMALLAAHGNDLEMPARPGIEIGAVVDPVLGVDVSAGFDEDARGIDSVGVCRDQQRRCSIAVARVNLRALGKEQLPQLADELR